MSRGGRREGSGGAGVPVKGETGDVESGSSVNLEEMERGGIAGGRPLPSLSLGTRLILLDELTLDPPTDDCESRRVAYRAGLRRDCWTSRAKAFVRTASSSSSGSSSGSGGCDGRAGRRGSGGFWLGRGVMVGRSSPEFESNGSSKGVVSTAAGCTGRRGRGGGTVPDELGLARVESLLWLPLEFRSTSLVQSRRRSGTGGGSLVARRCLVEGGGLLLSGALFSSRVARSRGEVEGDGDPICCFGSRDGGGGGGGRLRRELDSE